MNGPLRPPAEDTVRWDWAVDYTIGSDIIYAGFGSLKGTVAYEAPTVWQLNIVLDFTMRAETAAFGSRHRTANLRSYTKARKTIVVISSSQNYWLNCGGRQTRRSATHAPCHRSPDSANDIIVSPMMT